MKFLITAFLILFNSPVFAKQCIMGELDRYDNTKFFNIKEYNERKKNDKTSYMDRYGNQINDSKSYFDNKYQRSILIKDTPYSMKKTYDENGKLYSIHKAIKFMEFGESKVFDKKKGDFTVYNMDKDFQFGLCDLIKKINAEYSLNIEDKNVLYRLSRDIDEDDSNRLIYTLVVAINPNPNIPFYKYIIDGTTGDILKVGPGGHEYENHIIEPEPID